VNQMTKRLLSGLSLGGLLVGLTCVGALTGWRKLIDRPDHIARECDLVAALEKQRLIVSDDLGPAPLEWRRAEVVVGEPRAWRTDKHTSMKHRLIGVLLNYSAPRNDSAINCSATLDRAQVPLGVGNAERRKPEQLDTFGRARYSRAVFLPGGSYAIVSRTFCDVTRRGGEAWNTGWDQKTRTDLWQRDGNTWVLAEPRSELLLWYAPRYRLPARCFSLDVSG
jgi:hypothetical protein